MRKYLHFPMPTYLLPSLLHYFLRCSFFFILSYFIFGIFITSVCPIPFLYFLPFYLLLFLCYFRLSLMLNVSHFCYILRFFLSFCVFLYFSFLYALFFVLRSFLCIRYFCVMIRVAITPVFILRFQRIVSSVL